MLDGDAESVGKSRACCPEQEKPRMTHDYLVRSDDPCQTAGPVLDGERGPYRLVCAGL